MPYKEREIKKIYFSIGEVADMFRVNASLIRFWEKEFDIIKPQKNKKGNRLFTQQDIENFQRIFQLVKEQGYTLQGAKDKLKAKPELKHGRAEMLKSLQKIRNSLLELSTRLQ